MKIAWRLLAPIGVILILPPTCISIALVMNGPPIAILAVAFIAGAMSAVTVLLALHFEAERYD